MRDYWISLFVARVDTSGRKGADASSELAHVTDIVIDRFAALGQAGHCRVNVVSLRGKLGRGHHRMGIVINKDDGLAITDRDEPIRELIASPVAQHACHWMIIDLGDPCVLGDQVRDIKGLGKRGATGWLTN